MVVEFLNQLNFDERDFPIFFHRKWLLSEQDEITRTLIYYDSDYRCLISFSIKKLKIVLKGEYNYIPVDTNGNPLNVVDEKSSIEKFHLYLKKNRICDVLLPPQHFVNFNIVPSNCLFFKIGILKVNLESSEVDFLSKLNSENRRQIKRAKEKNITTEFGNHLIEDFYKTYLSTNMSKNISSFDLDFFKKLVNFYGENCLIGVCYFNGIPQAGVFDVFDRNNAYSLFSGTVPNLEVKGAKKHLINEEFNLLRNRKIYNYIFGGYREHLSKEDSLFYVQDFKKSMGAKVHTGVHFVKVFSPFKYSIFNFLLAVKSIFSGSKLGLINLNGVDVKKSK